jgi:hypothetical protein
MIRFMYREMHPEWKTWRSFKVILMNLIPISPACCRTNRRSSKVHVFSIRQAVVRYLVPSLEEWCIISLDLFQSTQ